LAAAATVTNYLGAFAAPVPFCYSLAVNAGDTVVWVNAVPSYEGTSHVESYGGEFNSPPLAAGDVFSYTFTNAGFYAYRTGVWYDSPAGTVAVASWTSAPPAIAINSPVEGELIRYAYAFPVLTTVASANNVAEIQYFANSALVGVATNPAYGTFWLPASATLAPPGAYVLQARAVYRQGVDGWSQPITLSLSPYDGVLYGPRVLPTGEFLLTCSQLPLPECCPLWLVRSESLENLLLTNVTTVLRVNSWGVFVDEGARGAGLTQAFYAILRGPPGPIGAAALRKPGSTTPTAAVATQQAPAATWTFTW
jgi:hypothetical protein